MKVALLHYSKKHCFNEKHFTETLHTTFRPRFVPSANRVNKPLGNILKPLGGKTHGIFGNLADFFKDINLLKFNRVQVVAMA